MKPWASDTATPVQENVTKQVNKYGGTIVALLLISESPDPEQLV